MRDSLSLEQEIEAMLEKRVIQMKPFSWCFGMVDVIVVSGLLTDQEVRLSVCEDDWNDSPVKCVAKKLAELIMAGKTQFISGNK